MMIMRPPQHGHGCESGLGSLAFGAVGIPGLGLCRWYVEHAVRSDDVVGARGAGECGGSLRAGRGSGHPEGHHSVSVILVRCGGLSGSKPRSRAACSMVT
jgi:hypothetical protein